MSKELYVTSSFTIPSIHSVAALAALNALAATTNGRLRQETLLAALREYGSFAGTIDAETGAIHIGFDGETNEAADEAMLRVIAPFASEGEVVSEHMGTGNKTRYTFANGQVLSQDEEKTWGSPTPLGQARTETKVALSVQTRSLDQDLVRLRTLAEDVIVARQVEDTIYDDAFGELNDLLSAMKDHLLEMALRYPDRQDSFTSNDQRGPGEPLSGSFVDVVTALDNIYDKERAEA